MTRRASSVLAWTLASVCFVLAVPTIVLLVVGVGAATPADGFGLAGYGGAAFLFAALAFASTGAMIAARVPANPIGWLFCITGLSIGVGDLAYQYADYALYIAPSAPPGGVAAALVQNLGLPPAFGVLGLALLLFPAGRLPSRRWLPAVLPAMTGVVCLAIGYLLRPGPLDFPFGTVDNPIGVDGAFALMDSLVAVGWLATSAGVAVAAVSLGLRLRGSRGDERQQLKWVALAAAVLGAVLVTNVITFIVEVQGIDQLRIVVVATAFAGFPIAAAIAILRYRLYDVDIVINRTLVYGGLTATLGAAYLGSVLLLQLLLTPLTERSDLAVAGSTLLVAALFRPARTRIQAFVDRRFYRSRYDAAQTLAAFSGRLREQLNLEALSTDLRDVVRETMRPAHVSLWLRED